VGRRVNLDILEKLFDTRIAPQNIFEFDYFIDKFYNTLKTIAGFTLDFHGELALNLISRQIKIIRRKDFEENLS